MAMYLPEGILMTVLQQLPTHSLCRFKCVSKSWRALITSLPKQDVLVKREVKNEETGENEVIFSALKYPFTGDHDDDDDDDKESILSSFFGQEFKHSLVYGHSHGIVCFSGAFDNIFLYNPATGELRKLPPSVLISPFIYLQCFRSLGVGFGYDSKSRDLKVVRIVGLYIHNELEDYTRRPPRAEVYDLEKDGWREIKTPIPANPIHIGSFDMYYQGCYYWWALATDIHIASREVILCFDFTDEVFTLISMPDDLYYPDKEFTSLAVLNGSIVLLNYPCDGNVKCFDVWKMVKDDDHDGAVVSWTKLFTFGPLVGIDCPLAFLSSDELLMEDNEGRLILCNILNTQHCKKLPIKGKRWSIEASLFVKTAMPINGGYRLH